MAAPEYMNDLRKSSQLGFGVYSLASGNARMRTYISGSFGRLRKHEQSCATVCMFAFLITNGDINY